MSTADYVEAAVKANAALTCSSKKRKFSGKNETSHTKSFLQYGFTFISENNDHRPLFLICFKVWASESLKPAKVLSQQSESLKLKRHLQTEHDLLLLTSALLLFFAVK